jgi:hypothetical protein
VLHDDVYKCLVLQQMSVIQESSAPGQVDGNHGIGAEKIAQKLAREIVRVGCHCSSEFVQHVCLSVSVRLHLQ